MFMKDLSKLKDQYSSQNMEKIISQGIQTNDKVVPECP